jgi:hypothetical protein
VHGLAVYDEQTIQELFWFIINRQGKPEAMKGKHDDHVISLGVAWQLYNRCEFTSYEEPEKPEWADIKPVWARGR